MKRWRAAFWTVIALGVLAVTCMSTLQLGSGSWDDADQIGGALSLQLVWIVPLVTLLVQQLWQRAYPPPPNRYGTRPTEEAIASPISAVADSTDHKTTNLRGAGTLVWSAIRNKRVLAGVAAACTVIAVAWGLSAAAAALQRSQAPTAYSGVAYISGDQTLHFGSRSAEITSGIEKQSILESIERPENRRIRTLTLVPDIAVVTTGQAGRTVQLNFLSPAAVLGAAEQGRPNSCNHAMQKATKQRDGSYVVVQLNSEATVCITPRDGGMAQIAVLSGPVEFRIAYAFSPHA